MFVLNLSRKSEPSNTSILCAAPKSTGKTGEIPPSIVFTEMMKSSSFVAKSFFGYRTSTAICEELEKYRAGTLEVDEVTKKHFEMRFRRETLELNLTNPVEWSNLPLFAAFEQHAPFEVTAEKRWEWVERLRLIPATTLSKLRWGADGLIIQYMQKRRGNKKTRGQLKDRLRIVGNVNEREDVEDDDDDDSKNLECSNDEISEYKPSSADSDGIVDDDNSITQEAAGSSDEEELPAHEEDEESWDDAIPLGLRSTLHSLLQNPDPFFLLILRAYHKHRLNNVPITELRGALIKSLYEFEENG